MPHDIFFAMIADSSERDAGIDENSQNLKRIRANHVKLNEAVSIHCKQNIESVASLLCNKYHKRILQIIISRAAHVCSWRQYDPNPLNVLWLAQQVVQARDRPFGHLELMRDQGTTATRRYLSEGRASSSLRIDRTSCSFSCRKTWARAHESIWRTANRSPPPGAGPRRHSVLGYPIIPYWHWSKRT